MKTKSPIKKIAILTGGGDCPGLNAVIRAVTRSAILDHKWEVWGIEDGFEGLIDGRCFQLTLDHVAGILPQGGTILGTSNRINPFQVAVHKVGEKIEYRDASSQADDLFKKYKWDALVCVGGDGTMSFARRFSKQGWPIAGIPKTIDNDVPGTERTVGFYSAVHTATKAIDHLHTTAASHHRTMIVEVMGRNSGWIALASGIAGGGDIILIPEQPFDLQTVYEKVKERSSIGRRFTIMVVAEGAAPRGGEQIIKRKVKDVNQPIRLGGVGPWLAEKIEQETGIEARAVVLGHLLRSGAPIYQDRLLATAFGCEVVGRLAKGEKNFMMAWKEGAFYPLSFKDMSNGFRLVPKHHPWIQTCKSMGSIFG